MTNFICRNFKKYLANYDGVPAACWAAVFLTFVQCVASGVCYFISLYFVGTLHTNIVIAGVMLSCYGIGTVCGGMLSGKLCDRFPTTYISIASLMILSICFILLATLSGINLLMIDLFVLGLSAYSFKTSNGVWMLNQCGSDEKLKVKVINLSRVAINLGLGISGVIIGLFAEHGFKNIFYLFGIMLFISSIYLVMQKRQESSNNESDGVLSNTHVSNRKILFIILFTLFCVGLMIAQLGSTYPVYLIDAFPAMGMRSVSALYLLDTFLIVLVQAPLTNALGNYNKMLIMGVGAFMMGGGMLILSASHIFALAVISCIIWTTGEMLFMPVSQLLCYENGGAKKKGQAMGIYQTVYACSAIIGPAAGGLIYHHTSGNNVWYSCSLLGVLCLSMCIYYTRSSLSIPGFYANAAPQKG